MINLYSELGKKSRRKNKTIIFPESYDNRVIEAVKKILSRKISKVILIQKGPALEKLILPHKNLTIIDAKFGIEYLDDFYKIRTKKNSKYDIKDAESDISDPLIFSCFLLKNNFADGIVAGCVYPTSEVLRNAISIIGFSKNNNTVSSFFLFTFPKRSYHSEKIIAFADCGVIPVPTSEQLSEIAIQTADNFKKLTGLKPKLAFLSFSTKGSSKDISLKKILEAVEITKRKNPKLVTEGELQFDAAFVPEVAMRKNPNGKIKGDANVFIFPDLNSGNIAYKITERIGLATATGPIVQGLAMPVMDLSRGCNSSDIVNMASVVSNL